MSGALQAVYRNLRSFGPSIGSQSYTTAGTYSWVAPSGVTAVSVVTVGAGGLARRVAFKGNVTWYGAGGGGLAYKNNISVTPGSSYSVYIGALTTWCSGREQSYFCNQTFVAAYSGCGTSAGSVRAGCGSSGGNATSGNVGAGGGGAGGYAGSGGGGGYSSCVICPCTGCPTFVYCCGISGAGGAGGGGGTGFGGGGVGLYGQGSSGSSSGGGGSGGTNGNGCTGAGGSYGGGAGIRFSCTPPNPWSGVAGSGAVRIVWPGNTRKFPSTCVGTP